MDTFQIIEPLFVSKSRGYGGNKSPVLWTQLRPGSKPMTFNKDGLIINVARGVLTFKFILDKPSSHLSTNTSS